MHRPMYCRPWLLVYVALAILLALHAQAGTGCSRRSASDKRSWSSTCRNLVQFPAPQKACDDAEDCAEAIARACGAIGWSTSTIEFFEEAEEVRGLMRGRPAGSGGLRLIRN